MLFVYLALRKHNVEFARHHTQRDPALFLAAGALRRGGTGAGSAKGTPWGGFRVIVA